MGERGAFKVWTKPDGSLEADCAYCRERLRAGDDCLSVPNVSGGEMLRLHLECLPRVRTSLPSVARAREALEYNSIPSINAPADEEPPE